MKKSDDKKQEPKTPENNDLLQALEKIKDLEDKLLRTIADLQNIRRRASEEKVNLLKSGGIQVIEKILPALDNLDRAFVILPKELEENDWVKGIFTIKKTLFEALKENGLQVIDEINVHFDPNLHEAIQLDKNGEKGIVMEIFEKGFMVNGKVLRVAKVKVGDK